MENKRTCRVCGITQDSGEFYRNNLICRECKNAQRREYRAKTNNADTHKYEKTKKGFLMRLYRNMQSRVEGVQWMKHHLYKDKYLLPREEFYEWSWNSDKFHELFDVWEKSEYNRKLTPSVDRVDSSKGYYLWNIEWVTHSENSSRGSRRMHEIYNGTIYDK